MKILEIPPYRKNQLSQNPTAIVNPSPPRVSEIPSFKSRKSNDWQPTPIDNSSQEFQLHLPSAMNSDLVRRLKNTESTVHRSIDCIAGSKAENVKPNEASIKVAPSWTNVAQRSESITSTTGAAQSGGSKKSSIDDETKGKFHFQNNLFTNISYTIPCSVYILLFGQTLRLTTRNVGLGYRSSYLSSILRINRHQTIFTKYLPHSKNGAKEKK